MRTYRHLEAETNHSHVVQQQHLHVLRINSSYSCEVVEPESDHVANIVLQKDLTCFRIPPIRVRTPSTIRTGYVLDLVPGVLKHLNEHLQVGELHGW